MQVMHPVVHHHVVVMHRHVMMVHRHIVMHALVHHGLVLGCCRGRDCDRRQRRQDVRNLPHLYPPEAKMPRGELAGGGLVPLGAETVLAVGRT